jgi:hypothetical protein
MLSTSGEPSRSLELRKRRREYKSGERRGYDPTIAEVVQEIADAQWGQYP